MGNLLSRSVDEEVREALLNNDQASAAAVIQKYLDNQENIPLNIAVTGETGSGKSSFINTIRGLGDDDEGAAPVGDEETTIEVTPYPHPNFPKVILWDLPGIGTMNFKAAEYLKKVKFVKYDFFIIISDRFREHDVKLAKEIKKKKKNFYFVRSKIDNHLRDKRRSQREFSDKRRSQREFSDKRRSQREFSEEEALTHIRETCIQGLQKQGFWPSQVFLVSNKEPGQYDFPELLNTLERELPELKKNAFLLAMPNTSLEMIDRKKKAFQSKIKYLAYLSAAVAGVPVPGVSAAVDLSLLVAVVTRYVLVFGLDISSLKKMANYTGIPYEELKKVTMSPLVAVIITPTFLLKIIGQTVGLAALMAAEEVSRFIPVLGIPLSMVLSFTFTYNALNIFLDMLADDARKVFERTGLRGKE